MHKFEKANYSNNDNAELRLYDKKKSLQNLLFRVYIDYANKISGSNSNNDLSELRESVSLRLESVFYHYKLLYSLNVSGQEIVGNDLLSPLESKQIALKQDFLFDSIVFNTVSLFDYTSCLIKFSLESNKQIKKLLWTKLANTARGVEEFKESSLAKVIDEVDRKWVDKLGKYRAELIHYSDDFVDESFKHSLLESKFTITVYAPLSFKKHFKEFKLDENKNASINEVTLWIIENSIDCLTELLRELCGHFDIIRKIPVGNEVYTFQKDSE